LLERGIVQEVLRESVPEPIPSASDPNRAEIGFVGYFRTPALLVFDAYREAMSLVVGSGPLLPAVVRALERSGVRCIRAAADVTGDSDADAGLRELVAAAGLVVDVSPGPMDQRSLWLELECGRQGIPLAQAAVGADGIWICPAGVPGPDRASLASGWLRRSAMGAASPHGLSPTPAGAVVAANLLVHDAFRYATGTRPAAGPPALTRVSLEGTACDSHRLLAHPRTRRAGPQSEEQFRALITQLEGQPAMTENEFSQRAARLADNRLGIFGEVSEGDFAQLPLHVAQAVVSDPMDLLGSAPRPLAIGAGLDFRAARFQAALRALAMYGSLMVDPRRLLPPGGSRAAVPLRDARVHAIGLTDARVHLVPAMLAFPALRRPVSPYRLPPGTAAGYSWRGALEAALVDLCLRLGVAEALRSRQQFPPVDLDAAPLDEAAVRLLAYLACPGEPVVVHDVTGSLGVPTFACALGARLLAYGCGRTVTEAIRSGLERLVLSWQAQLNAEPAYAPRTWPRIAPPGDELARKPVERLPMDLGALARALHRHGHIPLAVPFDHDQELHALMPFVVRVVIQPCSTG
jgi:YcaO cyclodehydratase, ATP-ad Mg2+-binding